jgi:pimeloyl-ACP methyl ester carboxylesterase
MTDSPASFLPLDNGHTLAYHKFTPKHNNNDTPGVIFLGGFKSDMQGSKAIFLQDFCQKNDIPFVRMDYLGHGESSGVFTDFTIGDWADNVVTALDELTTGKQIIIGSSMGGWLMLLAAIARPNRLHSLIGIAAAPDFTEDLMWAALSDDEKTILERDGQYTLPLECHHVNQEDFEPYTITHRLITEARKHLLLGNSISIECPVRLIHGLDDEDVPHRYSLSASEKIVSSDVQVILQKNGDHRMSTTESLSILESTLQNILS